MRKFKYAPKGIPPLTEEQWKELEKEMDNPLTEKQKEIWRRAEEIYRHSRRGQPMEYNDEVMVTSDGQQWIYDEKHHEWINVTLSEKLKSQMVPIN